jgi:hypothetical protein
MRPFAQPPACMEFAGRVHSALARSRRPDVDWFSRPRLTAVAPYLGAANRLNPQPGRLNKTYLLQCPPEVVHLAAEVLGRATAWPPLARTKRLHQNRTRLVADVDPAPGQQK